MPIISRLQATLILFMSIKFILKKFGLFQILSTKMIPFERALCLQAMLNKNSEVNFVNLLVPLVVSHCSIQ